MIASAIPGQDVINLADVADGVLARRSLEAHGPARRDQAIDPIAASDLAIVAGLGRCPGHHEVDGTR